MKNLILFLLIIASYNSHSQIYEPCFNGSQMGCRCETAPIIENITILNGFEYDMSLYQHPDDGPEPMCPPPFGSNTTSHNPTWLAFKATCQSLQIILSYTNCKDGPGAPSSNNFGVQAAVYAECPATPVNAISCGTSVSGCVDNGQRTLSLNNLTVGNIYYLLVDGCAGSACHITLNILNCQLPSSVDSSFQFCNDLSEPPYAMTAHGVNHLLLYNGSEFVSINKSGQQDQVFHSEDLKKDDLLSKEVLISSNNFIYGVHQNNGDYILRKYENNGTFTDDIYVFEHKPEKIFIIDHFLFALSNRKIFKFENDDLITDNLLGINSVKMIYADTFSKHIVITSTVSSDISTYNLNGSLIKKYINTSLDIANIIAQNDFINVVIGDSISREIIIFRKINNTLKSVTLPPNVMTVNLDLSNSIYIIEKLGAKIKLSQLDHNGNAYVVKTLNVQMLGENYTSFTSPISGDIYLSGSFEYVNNSELKQCNLIRIEGPSDAEKKFFFNTNPVSCNKKGLIKFVSHNFDLNSLKYFVNDSLISSDSFIVEIPGWYQTRILDYKDTFELKIFVSGQNFTNATDLRLSLIVPDVIVNSDVPCSIFPKSSCTFTGAKVTFYYSNQYLNYVSSNIAPDSIYEDRLVWMINKLQYLQPVFRVKNFTHIGKVVTFISKIESENDVSSGNNEVVVLKTILGAFDPNDISVSPFGVCKENYVIHGLPLNYHIRFQNIGNYPAKDVVIVDSLGDYFDINSIEIIDRSHGVEVVNTRNNILHFNFKDIYLPGVEQDEKGSNGFITFSVKLKPNLNLPVSVANYADIYFDQNPPITTNIVYNTINSAIPSITTDKFFEACKTDIIAIEELPGILITKDTAIIKYFKSVDACDSIVNYTFKFNDLNITNDTTRFCDGSQILINPGNLIIKNDTVLVFKNECSIHNKYYRKTALPGIIVVDTLAGELHASSNEPVKFQWVDCTNNGYIENATDSKFKPLTSGNYACEIASLTSGCVNISPCYNVIVSSTTELESHIKIYPNPSSGTLNIVSDFEIGASEIKIYNAMGQEVFFNFKRLDSTSLILDHLPKGVLLINVSNNGKLHKTAKVLVE